MSNDARAGSSTKNCSWCSKPIASQQQSASPCPSHRICNRCRLPNGTSQSVCPCCWHDHGLKFIDESKICAVCHCDLKSNGAVSRCKDGHPHCSGCSPAGCFLCSFLRLRSTISLDSATHPTEIQRVINACRVWQTKSEELKADESSAMEIDEVPVQCMICFDNVTPSDPALAVCQHQFHRSCIDAWFQSSGKQSCPTCGHLYGIGKGPQPPNGTMTVNYLSTPLSGFPRENRHTADKPTIEIIYEIRSGTQGPLNPHPGQPFIGTIRRAYLPNNTEGKQILELLRRAFNDQYLFTVGKSSTTGQENVVTWNDIHHKTSLTGGPENYGYPDPTYFQRVRRELADKGFE